MTTEWRLETKAARCTVCRAPHPVGAYVFVDWVALKVYCGWDCWLAACYNDP